MRVTCGANEVAEPLGLQLTVQRPILPLKAIEGVDASYNITGKCQVVLFNFTQFEFLLLVKLFDLNLGYDDHMEWFMNPETPMYKQVEDDPTHLGAFIRVHLDVGQISILIKNEEESITELITCVNELGLVRYNDHYLQLDLVSRTVQLYIPEQPSSDPSLASHIAETVFNAPLKHVTGSRLPVVVGRPIEEEEGGVMLTVHMEEPWTTNKLVLVGIFDVGLFMNWAILEVVLNFFDCGIPEYENESETPNDYRSKYRPKLSEACIEAEELLYAPRIDFSVAVTNPFVVFPADSGTRVLVSQGDLQFSYFREHEFELIKAENVRIEAKRKELIWKNLELFSVREDALTSIADLKRAGKRKIVTPFTLKYKSVLESKGKKYISQFLNWEFTPLHMVVSLNDLKQCYQSYLYQEHVLEVNKEMIESLALVQAKGLLEEELADQYNRSKFLRKTVNIHRERLSSMVDMGAFTRTRASCDLGQKPAFPADSDLEIETQYTVPNLHLTLINDSVGAYGPLLSAEFNLPIAKQSTHPGNSILHIEVFAQMKYYNPFIDCWEPLIEPFDAVVQYRTLANSFPRTQTVLTLGAQKQLCINVPEALSLHLYKVMTMWEKLGTEPKSESVAEQVSPFSIENLFGSAIVMQTDREAVQIIEPGVVVPYEIQMEGHRDFSIPTEGVKLVLTHEGMDLETLTGINLKKVQCIAREFKYQENIYTVLLETKLIDTRKILTVRSAVVFKNETNQDVHLYFPFRPKLLTAECKSRTTCPVPFLYTHKSIGFLPLVMDDVMLREINLEKFLAQKRGYILELPNDQYHLILQVQKHKENAKKTTIRILPPLRIQNLLPCEFLISFLCPQSRLQTPFQRVSKGEDLDVHSFSLGEEVMMVFEIKDMRPSGMIPIVMRNPKDRKNSFVVADGENKELELLIGYKDDGCRLVNIYAAVTLVNHTKLPLTFYTRKRGSNRQVPVQDPGEPILCSPCKKIVAELNGQRSNVFRTEVAGARSVLTLKSAPDRAGNITLYQLTYNVDVAWPRPQKTLYTRNVTLSPRLILVNQLRYALMVCQSQSQAEALVLQPGDRNAFFWANAKLPELVEIRPAEAGTSVRQVMNEKRWDWSGEFSVTSVGTVVVQCKDRKGDFLIITAEVRAEDTAALVVFHEEGKFSSYRVENKSQRMTFGIFQDTCRSHLRLVSPMTSLPFGWTKPLSPMVLIVEVYLGYGTLVPVFLTRFKLRMDKLKDRCVRKARTGDELGYYIYTHVHNAGSALVLEVGDGQALSSSSADAEEDVLIQTHIVLPTLGISVIESQWPNVRELVYIQLTDIECMVEQTQTLRTAELKIGTLQVDNQYNLMPLHPVLAFQQPESDDHKDVFKMLTTIYLEDSMKSFQEVSVLLQTMNVRVESVLVQRLVAFYLRALDEVQSWNRDDQLDALFRKDSPSSLSVPTWMTRELPSNQTKLYIETLRLFPVKIIFSFVTLKDENEDAEDTQVLAILQSRGMLLLSIDSATIKFPSCDFAQVYISQKQLIQAIVMHYTEQAKGEAFRLIWHTDILGSPIGFVSNLGTAVFDLVNEPVQGIIHGPLEGGKGLLKGANSFIKNSFSATFGTVSKLTGSMATGITALTQGKEAMLERQREKAANKPKDMADGVVLGMKSIAMGIGKGVAGVITEPIKGAKKKGFLGFLSGGVKGIAGIVGKPITGVLDAVSKTAEGINNTAHQAEQALGSQRSRLPRVTYGLGHRIRKYNETDAEISAALFSINPEYGKLAFCYQDVGQSLDGQETVWVVYQERVIATVLSELSVLWECEITDIAQAEQLRLRNGVCIRQKPGRRGEQRQPYIVLTDSPKKQEKLIRKLRQVCIESEQSRYR